MPSCCQWLQLKECDMRILIITDSLPYPLISGDKIRIYNLLRRIAQQHEIWLACVLDTTDYVPILTHLKEFCCGVEAVDIKKQHPLVHLPGLIWYALTGKPLELKFTYSRELAIRIRSLAEKENFDVIEIQHSFMAMYIDAIPRAAKRKTILTFHNVIWKQYENIFRYERRLVDKIRQWIFSKMMRKWEPKYALKFARCIAVSNTDKDLLISDQPDLHVDIVANGVDAKGYMPLPPCGDPRTLMFVGKMSYSPCIDAVLYFYEEILPLIQSKIDDVEFWVVGREPPPEVLSLNGKNGAHVTGYVNDVMPYYANSAICVVPLRSGGGTRLKILEAMALGRPVVSSTIGCEGLDVTNGKNILIADDPETFAQKTIQLLKDQELYQRIATEARQLVEMNYDWDILAGRLLKIYDELPTDSQPFVGQ